jgi:hypothetical protein
MSALTQFLEDHIVSALQDYQQSNVDVKGVAIDLINPDEPPYVAVNHALARMSVVHTEIQNARDAGDLYPWVLPRFASMAFEGIFETCVGVWLVAGQSAQPTQLKPSVHRFIKSQVRMFAAVIGDH